MAASSLATLGTRVQYILGERSDLEAECKDWVNDAYIHLTQSYEFPEAFATDSSLVTVASQDYVAQPSDFFSIYTAKNLTSGKRLIQLSPTAFDTAVAREASPTHYAIFDSNIYLYPTPDDVESIRVRYRKFFTPLTTNDQIHELPEAWDRAIILLAAAFGFDELNEVERALHYRQAASIFIRTQEARLAANLYDRNEPVAVIGSELVERN